MYEFIDKRSNKSLWKLIGNNKNEKKEINKRIKEKGKNYLKKKNKNWRKK